MIYFVSWETPMDPYKRSLKVKDIFLQVYPQFDSYIFSSILHFLNKVIYDFIK